MLKNKFINWYQKEKMSSQSLVPDSRRRDMFDKEITRGPVPAVLPYREGMKVRNRRKGIGMPQEYGIIKNINGEKMAIQWFDRKQRPTQKEIFNLGDTVALSAIVSAI